MHKARTYSYIFLLVLLLFPLANKVAHQFEHYNSPHCNTKALHFCDSEHICNYCDYIFSKLPSFTPTHHQYNFIIPIKSLVVLLFLGLVKPTTSLKYRLLLRGPPFR